MESWKYSRESTTNRLFVHKRHQIQEHKLVSLEDSYAYWGEDRPPAVSRFLRKLRYKSASLGLPLTPNEARIRSWRNRYAGKRAFLIGNGPSLNKLDLSPLANEITFGVNAIYLNKDTMGFLPTHYIVEDVFVAEDRAQEIIELQGPTKWFGNYLDYCLGNADANWLNVLVDYRNYPGFPHFGEDASRLVWVGGTVSYIGMQLAYFMGVQNLYLLGFDHSYEIPESTVVEGNEILSTESDPNHFHDDYFGKGFRWHKPQVERMELSYERAKAYYNHAGREIINATAGGKLEVFPREGFDKLFDTHHA